MRDDAAGAASMTTREAFCSSGKAVRRARLASLPPSQATATTPPIFKGPLATTVGRCSSATICWKASARGPLPRAAAASNTTTSQSRPSMARAAHTGDLRETKLVRFQPDASLTALAARSPSAPAWRMLSTAVACTPPMKPSPIQGIRSATSAGAWTQASSASKACASTAPAATMRRSPSPPDSGAMILAQSMSSGSPEVLSTRKEFKAPRRRPLSISPRRRAAPMSQCGLNWDVPNLTTSGQEIAP